MPNSNEEPLRPAGETAPAPASTPADSVSKVNEQLASTTLSDQGEAPPADAGDTKPKEHPDLWKPHPPTEECPVSMVPLPLENAQSIYWSCCGKMICTACDEEHKRSLNVTNRKRHKKKLPPLEFTCAFCRSPVPDNDAEMISSYEERSGKGDIRAIVNLAGVYVKGDRGLRKNNEKAFELLNRAADLGSVDAIAILGNILSFGHFDVTIDRSIGKEYLEDAVAKGHLLSRHRLAILLAQEDNYDLAIKHWHLGAAAGCDDSVKNLWKCFYKRMLSKQDLEKVLRAHKAACDEMNSEERERYDASQEALAGNDELLIRSYASYYRGYINAKELKKALKAHADGDRMAVETFLANKIRAGS